MIRAIVLLFISTFSFALTADKTDGFSGNFDLGLNYTQNIDNILQFNNVFLANYKHKKSALSLNNNISFISQTGKEEMLNKGLQDLKYSFNTNELGVDLTLQHLYDISRSIKRRWTTGIGISYAVIKSDIEKVRLGVSFLRERETPMEGEQEMNSRMSGGVDFTIKLLDNVELLSKNYYQPNIENIGDFRWKTNLSLRITINSHFLFSLNNTFNYDSYPKLNIPEMDYQLINSLSYNF
jgi:putative salt-induced outer membrane protein YdiY